MEPTEEQVNQLRLDFLTNVVRAEDYELTETETRRMIESCITEIYRGS